MSDASAAMTDAAFMSAVSRHDGNASHFVARNLSSIFLIFFGRSDAV